MNIHVTMQFKWPLLLTTALLNVKNHATSHDNSMANIMSYPFFYEFFTINLQASVALQKISPTNVRAPCLSLSIPFSRCTVNYSSTCQKYVFFVTNDWSYMTLFKPFHFYKKMLVNYYILLILTGCRVCYPIQIFVHQVRAVS